MKLQHVRISPRPLTAFSGAISDDLLEEALSLAEVLKNALGSRVIWNVNSTEHGGGVAEMLQSILGYGRGAGVDIRWVVISGDEPFFHITKRLHNALHGDAGDRSLLGGTERNHYEAVLHDNAVELASQVRPGDVVILHDPQTLGMAEVLAERGAHVIWRCHVGTSTINAEVERGWSFLERYFEHVERCVFTRMAYVPRILRNGPVLAIPPSIDPNSAKNQHLDEATVHSILVDVGILEGPDGNASRFVRADGSPGRVERGADIIRLGRSPRRDTPLVAQVSRWDRLKDPIGVIRGFRHYLEFHGDPNVELVLAGPSVGAVVDDPEGADVLTEVISAWRHLPHEIRRHVNLVCLPMADVEENAAIVNALQRHATVVVQKSLQEGFGLTVTEAMWKARPVVASAVGGIVDQIEDGVSGLLVDDPTAPEQLSDALHRVLCNGDVAARLGRAAAERVGEKYLAVHSLLHYAHLIGELIQEPA